MQPTRDHTNEILSTVHMYFEHYFTNRDLDRTAQLFWNQATCVGTGHSEIAHDYNVLKELYRRDIREAPNRIDYTITKSSLYTPSDNVAVVLCELNVCTKILDQELKLNKIRLSLILVKFEVQWLIVHMHISFPTEAHGENEAYPIKELEERNKVLTKLVEERTKDLQRANEELQDKIKEIKTLHGLLPICSSCKKIRDDKGEWHVLEAYITSKSDATFSHGLCPECFQALYSEYSQKRNTNTPNNSE
ncbi:MAG: nuclear transport factor 2 family protein [Bacteroidetes bacterium]|nr:nuclear transport factor 2 family protein [Bacteroidota bacterium]